MKRKIPTNIALSPFGYWPKSSRRSRWIKPAVKLLFVMNLSVLGLIGCTDMNVDKTMVKAAIDSAIDASFEQSSDSERVKYLVASTASELFELGYEWVQRARRNWH